MEDPVRVKERLDALAHYDVLDRPAGAALQALVDLAARVFDVHGASVNLITADQERSVAASGVDPGACARESSMCSVFLDEPATVVVPDAGADERFATNPFVSGELGRTRFYASAPLRTPAGVPVGRLCVFDDGPRELDDGEQGMLRTLGEQVVNLFELALRTREVEETRAALDEARADVRRASEHLTLFAGQISHDLRTPLTAVKANAEMLAGEPEVRASPDLTWMVDGVTRAAERMNAMIEAVLDYARDGGRLRTAPLDLGETCRDVLEDLRPLVEASDAEVTVGDLPTVEAGEPQVRAVLSILLGNAIRFARPGVAPVVRVEAVRRGDRWRVSVSDNGIGVPEERRDAMFVLFARGDKRVEGSGIGLATVKRVAEAHGGRVGMDAPPEGGTSVWFELPA